MNLGKEEQSIGNSPDLGSEGSFSSGEPNKLIRFISLNAESGTENFDIIRDSIRSRGFAIDFFEFKLTNTKIQRRLIQPSKKDGPKERIEIEEKIDINSAFKYLRQVSAKVLKEVNNVFLVQVNQIKGFPCSLPLIFPDLFKAKRSVLVTGITDRVHIQLISKPDLSFKSIDTPISQNPTLRSKILERASREKSMQAIAREMKDFFGFPAPIKEKLNELAVGNKVPLSDEEAINIILISDLYTRYSTLFKTFERDIANRNQTVAALASQFVEMTQGIRTERLMEAFREYLVEEDSDGEAFACENNGQLFSYLYKKAQLIEESRVKIGDHSLTRAEMFNIMRSMITIARSQLDPGLWKQCQFFFKHEDLNTSKRGNSDTIGFLLSETYTRLKVFHSASSLSLLEIYLIHNIHRFITGKKVLVAKSDLSPAELGMIRSVVIPVLNQPETADDQSESIRLILGMQANLQNLINPLHTVGRVYGFLMGRRLRENVQKFLKPGLRELLSRFGKNFFIIFYEMAVQEPGLPISRNHFARWLRQKEYFKKPEDLGHIPNKLETFFDPVLTPKILMETGESCFADTYSEAEFTKEYESARTLFVDFLTNMQKDEKGFAKILSAYLANGSYNLRTLEFREFFKKTKLYKVLIALFNQSCREIKPKLKELAANNKMILKTTIELEPLLLLENIFQLAVEDQTIQIHLIAVPVKLEAELEPASAVFSRNLRVLMQRSNDPTVKELVRAIRILKVYQSAYLEYMKYALISILDRQINNVILKVRQQKNQTANHIRNHFENYEKLFVGSTAKLDLRSLIQYDAANKPKDEIYTLTLTQLLQSIVLFKSANHKLREYRSTIKQIRSLLKRIPSSKKDEESLTYLNQIAKFQEMISTPVEELNENILNLINLLAKKIKKTVEQGKQNKGVLAKLYSLWRKQNPSVPEKIDFYEPFVSLEGRGYEQKLFLEIAKAREVLSNIKRRKCMIFFPDVHQEDQFNVMMDTASFIVEREFETRLYVDISDLSKEQVEQLAQVLYPGNFFRLDRIKPIRLQK